MAAINFTGLASGLDTRAIVDAILNAERRPVELLQERQVLFSARKAALGELRSKLNDFKSALRDLSSESQFRGRLATVADEKILRATPGSGAETGIFEIEVTSLAAAHKVKSDGFVASDQGLVADGTITIKSGSKDLITVDVSAANGNNSLTSIRDAINSADDGVSAAILFDGSNYLLTVRAEETGTANALTITDTTDLNLDSNLVNAAADASVSVDGITVTSSTNKLTGTIPGVTLDLLATSTPGTPTTVEISQDNDSVVEAVQDIVNTYNDLVQFFNAQFSSDNPGPLQGDSTTRRAQAQLQTLFSGGVDGIPFGQVRALSSVGVSFDGRTGEASLDTGELRELLDTEFEQVGNLFLSQGTATANGIQYLSSTSDTEPGTYAVEVTTAAEQATLIGSTAISTLAQNESLTIKVGSEEVTVDLTSGSNLTQIVSSLNTALSSAGIGATASDDGGRLRITSSGYGSATQLTVTSTINDTGDGQRTGFDDTAAVDTGVDVVGKIAGVTATGIGQVLGAVDGEDSAGLKLRVSATAAQITANGGDFGTISFSQGFVDTLSDKVEQFTRLGDGLLETATEVIDTRLESFADDIARLEERLSRREQVLLNAFGAAERAISLLQSQQSALGGF